MGFAGRPRAPDLEADAAVGEEQYQQREAVLQQEQDVGVHGFIALAVPFLRTDVQLVLRVPLNVRNGQLGQQKDRQRCHQGQ